MLSWKITLVDHRSAYAVPARFPAAERVLLARPEELSSILDLADFRAAVIMSHHLTSDLGYLRVLAASDIPFVGAARTCGSARKTALGARSARAATATASARTRRAATRRADAAVHCARHHCRAARVPARRSHAPRAARLVNEIQLIRAQLATERLACEPGRKRDASAGNQARRRHSRAPQTSITWCAFSAGSTLATAASPTRYAQARKRTPAEPRGAGGAGYARRER